MLVTAAEALSFAQMVVLTAEAQAVPQPLCPALPAPIYAAGRTADSGLS